VLVSSFSFDDDRYGLPSLCSSTITSGYICISLPKSRLDELDIPMMVTHNQEANKTAYTVTVDYKHGSFLSLAQPLAYPAWPTDPTLLLLDYLTRYVQLWCRYDDRHLCTRPSTDSS
jgi:hypothetical protein